MATPHTGLYTPQPRKEEWALIAAQQRKQHEEFVQQEKEKERLRKLAFKQALDKHVEQKKNQGIDEKLEDLRYRKRIIQVEEQIQEEEKRTKIEKIMARRAVEQQNMAMLSGYERSRSGSVSRVPDENGFGIGLGRDEQTKRRKQANTKILQQELQKQLKRRQYETLEMQAASIQQQNRDRQYSLDREKKRLQDLRRNKYHQQNMAVYNYYEQLKQQQQKRQKQLDQKIIQKPAYQKQLEEELKLRQQLAKKNKQTEEIKDSLVAQIEKHERDRSSRSFNQNEYSYKMYDKMFENKRKEYDKAEYLKYLKEQEAEHKRKKESEKYMSEEEYRLNMNQLNKVVNGQYVLPTYKDRSPANIGNPEELSKKKDNLYHITTQPRSPIEQSRKIVTPSGPLPEVRAEDMEVVRRRLEQLRAYNILTHSS